MPSPTTTDYTSLLAESRVLAPNCSAYLHAMAKMSALVGDFYLLLGRAFPPAPLPAGVALGSMGQCYKNAGELALSGAEQPLVYCEGYAMRPGLIPLHHAWCLDGDGRVVDPTWEHKEGTEYLGVALEEEPFLLQSLSKGVWGVLSEKLAPFVVDSHPRNYLHPQWQPSEDRMDAFWDRLQAALKTKSPRNFPA